MEYENDVSRTIASEGEDENKSDKIYCMVTTYTIEHSKSNDVMSASGVSISRSE